MRLPRGAILCGLVAALTVVSRAPAQGWGTIKGQAMYKDTKVLKPDVLKISKDVTACLKKGPILAEKYVVNPKNKGVRWVMVWLAKDDDGKADSTAALPLPPNSKAVKKKAVVMDQPCCRFEPHVVGLQKGQDFIGKNSSTIQHNMNIQGSQGPNINQLLVAGGQMTVGSAKWKPYHIPVSVSCNIHPWMKAYVFCFAHPYFAITDKDGKFEIKNAPAGKYRLIAWHEGMGWVLGDKSPSKNGKAITVKANGVTNVGKIAVMYDD